MKKYFGWLLFLGGLGLLLRVVNLDSVPPHLGNDEISIGFDSLSILKTGKDEHGHSWPISFESHRSYKSPLYAYLNMPIVAVFNNSEYGVRLLSVISGVLLIILVGLIGKKWGGWQVGLMAAGLMAINPKSIFVSRIGYEANLAVLMMSLGFYFWWKYEKESGILKLVVSGLFFGLSIWGYHTHWLLTPLLVLAVMVRNRYQKRYKEWSILILTIVVLALPIAYDFVNVQLADGSNRASSQVWYQDIGLQNYLNETNDVWIKKTVVILIQPVFNYLSHFSFDTFFVDGLQIMPSEKEPLSMGWFLLPVLPLIILGILKRKEIFKEGRSWLFTWFWLAPTIPSLTYGEVAAVRNLSFIVPTMILAGGGLSWLMKNRMKWFWTLVLSLVLVFGVFCLAYYVHFPRIMSDGFQYGYKQAWEYVKINQDQYTEVVVEPKFGRFGQFVGVPHLYFGYFGAFDVGQMQKRIDGDGTRVGKYWFKEVDWNQEEPKNGSLYIVSVINPVVGKHYEKMKLVETIYKPDFEPQFLIYKTKDELK